MPFTKLKQPKFPVIMRILCYLRSVSNNKNQNQTQKNKKSEKNET